MTLLSSGARCGWVAHATPSWDRSVVNRSSVREELAASVRAQLRDDFAEVRNEVSDQYSKHSWCPQYSHRTALPVLLFLPLLPLPFQHSEYSS